MEGKTRVRNWGNLSQKLGEVAPDFAYRFGKIEATARTVAFLGVGVYEIFVMDKLAVLPKLFFRSVEVYLMNAYYHVLTVLAYFFIQEKWQEF